MDADPTTGPAEPNVEVRLARPDEYEEIGRVTLSAWRPWTSRDDPAWRRFAEPVADVGARAKVAQVFVALDEGRIAGSVTLELRERIPDHQGSAPLEPGEAHIRLLGVAAAFRRRGIARRLVEQCILAARRAGKTCLTVDTAFDNHAARSLYVAVGFTRQSDVVRRGRSVASFVLPL